MTANEKFLAKRQRKQNLSRTSSDKCLSPQVKIYNRNFYLRQAQHDQIQEQYQKEIRKLSNTPKITPSSYAILSEKLEQSINSTIKKIVSYQSGTISFQQMKNVCKHYLIFPRSALNLQQTLFSQLWLLICGYQIEKQMSVHVFSSFLRILLDPYHLSPNQIFKLVQQIPGFENLQTKRLKFMQEIDQQIASETFSINETLILWNKIRKNSLTLKGFKKSQSRPILQERNHITYKPQINERSQKLAEKGISRYLYENKASLNIDCKIFNKDRKCQRNSSPDELSRYLHSIESELKEEQHRKSLSYHDILHKRALEKDKIVQIPSLNEEQIPKSQTAQPEEIKSIVNNLYYVKQRKQETNYSSIQEENQLKKCSFHPKINRKNSARSVSPGVNGYNQTVMRLHKGRAQQLRKRQAYQNLGKVKKPTDLEKKRAPSFIERDTPKLILEIRIDQQRVEKISLKGDQDPRIVAKKFVLKHSLSESMQSVLEELVQQQLNSL